jgi:hypothetical protein
MSSGKKHPGQHEASQDNCLQNQKSNHIPYYRLTRAPIDVTAGIALPALKLREDSSKENSGIRWFYRPCTSVGGKEKQREAKTNARVI